MNSEYDVLNGLTLEDMMWLKAHISDAKLFEPAVPVYAVQHFLDRSVLLLPCQHIPDFHTIDQNFLIRIFTAEIFQFLSKRHYAKSPSPEMYFSNILSITSMLLSSEASTMVSRLSCIIYMPFTRFTIVPASTSSRASDKQVKK